MRLLKRCPICKHLNITNLTLQGIEYSCCNNCGLVFRNPFPEKNEDPNLFGDASDFYLREEINDEKIAKEIKANISRVELIRKHDILGSYKSVLDVGCGLGFFVKAAMEEGYEAFGMEISEKMVEFCKSRLNIPVYFCTYDEFNQKVNDLDKFDVITIFHTLEHIRNQKDFFLFANGTLSPGGLLVIEIPYIFGFESLLNGEKWEGLSPTHLFYHTPNSLQILLNENNFRVMEVSFSISNFYYNNCHSYVAKFFRDRRKIDPLAQIFTGTSMTVIAQKTEKTRKQILNRVKLKIYGNPLLNRVKFKIYDRRLKWDA